MSAVTTQSQELDKLDETVVTFAATVAVLVGAVGWATLGWAWASTDRRPHWVRTETPTAKAGGALILSTTVGLVLLLLTPQLLAWQLLPAIALWAVVYVSAPAAKRALHQPR